MVKGNEKSSDAVDSGEEGGAGGGDDYGSVLF